VKRSLLASEALAKNLGVFVHEYTSSCAHHSARAGAEHCGSG
jgi:hypothetical protein